VRNTFLKTLIECAREDERIWLITADLGFSVVEKFAEEFPNRFLNVGIQEQNAVSLAAGLALSGKIPYVYSIIPFATMRCFEQIRVDVAYLNTNVRLVGVGAGLGYGPAGATHHAIEDIAIMRALPNMTVLCPGDPHEISELTRASARHQGPVYLRVGKGGEPLIHSLDRKITIGKAVPVQEGQDLTLLTTSNMLELGQKIVSEHRDAGVSAMPVSRPDWSSFRR
jgi:transketolase